MAGYFLLGFGVSNIVPIIFIAAGSQHRVPLNAAIAAVTTIGYSGTVLGPVIIGLIAHGSSLQTAFWFNITLLVLLAGIARVVFRPVYGLVGRQGNKAGLLRFPRKCTRLRQGLRVRFYRGNSSRRRTGALRCGPRQRAGRPWRSYGVVLVLRAE